eukprot:1169552-Rhodomonas_salina.2
MPCSVLTQADTAQSYAQSGTDNRAHGSRRKLGSIISTEKLLVLFANVEAEVPARCQSYTLRNQYKKLEPQCQSNLRQECGFLYWISGCSVSSTVQYYKSQQTHTAMSYKRIAPRRGGSKQPPQYGGSDRLHSRAPGMLLRYTQAMSGTELLAAFGATTTPSA